MRQYLDGFHIRVCPCVFGVGRVERSVAREGRIRMRHIFFRLVVGMRIRMAGRMRMWAENVVNRSKMVARRRRERTFLILLGTISHHSGREMRGGVNGVWMMEDSIKWIKR